MDKNMKRKQFHIGIAEEKIIYEAAKKNNISEAEVVRIAIREYGAKHKELQQNSFNSLIEMAKAAQSNGIDAYPNLSTDHDLYLVDEGRDESD